MKDFEKPAIEKDWETLNEQSVDSINDAIDEVLADQSSFTGERRTIRLNKEDFVEAVRASIAEKIGMDVWNSKLVQHEPITPDEQSFNEIFSEYRIEKLLAERNNRTPIEGIKFKL